MARLGDVALLQKPADSRSPKRFDCDQVTEHSADGAAFKLNPARLVYSLRWKHNAHPPDFELVLLRDPELWERWVNAANLTLLAELRRAGEHAIDWTAMGDVIPLLEAFEAAMGERFAVMRNGKDLGLGLVTRQRPQVRDYAWEKYAISGAISGVCSGCGEGTSVDFGPGWGMSVGFGRSYYSTLTLLALIGAAGPGGRTY